MESPSTDEVSATVAVENVSSITNRINDDQYYSEKLRATGIDLHRDRLQSQLTMDTAPTSPTKLFEDVLGNLVGAIQFCDTRNLDSRKNHKLQVETLLSRLQLHKQKLINNDMAQSMSSQNSSQDAEQYSSIITPHGNVHFDFSKQLIDSSLYMQLMQLVRLTEMDKFIEKVFHRSGEYHHTNYKERRRKQLLNDQEEHEHSESKLDRLHQSNCYITMAKAVHFRTGSNCFVFDEMDISSRFRYERMILQDTCHRLQRLQSSSATKQRAHLILVLCTGPMEKIYRLLRLLFKAYIDDTISVVYVTFEQIKSFLNIYEQPSEHTPSTGRSSLVTFSNPHPNFSPATINVPNLDETTGNDGIPISSGSPQNHSSQSEELVLDYLRTSSLILIFMKNLDEPYLTAFIRWYTDVVEKADPQFSERLTSTSNERLWLITSDYQRAETSFNFPKTNLFLWPTDADDFDHMSVVLSSILVLPIALNITYEIYVMFIDGMTMVDKHCREIVLDRNICVQMALIRIWSSISEEETMTMVVADEDSSLQSFGEYAQMLFSEYDGILGRKPITVYTSIQGIQSAKIFFEQTSNTKLPYDFITIYNSQKPTNNEDESTSSSSFDSHSSQELGNLGQPLQTDPISHPQTSILLDRSTPMTIGVLVGVYQMSIFFETVIRENITSSSSTTFSQTT